MPDLTNFKKLGLSDETLRALSEKGFEEPTKIQEECIPLLLKDQVDVIGQAQTGTGKTAAFGLPILEIVDPSIRAVQALILTPTRELAIQVADEITSLRGTKRIEVASIYGGASMDNQLRKLKRGVQVVVGTPGRIQDHLKRGSLKLNQLKFAVLDEADEMLDMGFIEDIENILSLTPNEKRMLCFSATMPKPILNLASRFMDHPTIVKVEQTALTRNLTDQVYFEVRESDKLEALCRIIDMEEAFYGIIFCRTKVQCDDIGRKLQERGYDAEALHGDLSQKQRELILNKMKSRNISIIVATDVAARGIDINDLTHVINYSIPQAPEAYIHRIGRTGRAGKMGTAITFITPSEFRKFNFIQRASKTDIRKATVPDAKDIISIRRERIESELLSLLTNNVENEQFIPIARKLLESYDSELVLASVLTHFYKDALDESKYKDLSTSRNSRNRDLPSRFSQDDGFVRLFIARGRKDGLGKRELVSYLTSQVKANDSDIQDVTVRDEFSFVSAPFEVAEDIIRIINKSSSGSKPLVSRAKPDNPNGKNLTRNKRPSTRRSESRAPRRSSSDDFQPYGRDSRGDDSWESKPSSDSRKSKSHGKYNKNRKRR
ncbi:MAG: DEAD/DEAH box helicase [Spirochaetia bacterium]|nr:DEAD/DEAH box helicase [Spirochaetia bacterium]